MDRGRVTPTLKEALLPLLITIKPKGFSKATPTLIDGNSFQSEAELMGIKALKLTRCEVLKDSYIRLEYDVIQDTIIDSR